MIVEDFVSDMVTQFKDPNDDDRNRVFYKNISTLAHKCKPESLSKLYNYIVKTETSTFPFAMGRYYKYMDKEGLEIKEFKKSFVSWRYCPKCKIHYSFEGRGCPNCRSTYSETRTDEYYPPEFIEVTDSCYYCSVYPEIEKNERWMTFKGCNDFGKKISPECRPCQCKHCCDLVRQYNNDPYKARELLDSGEIGHITLYDVDSLSETAKMMRDAILKSRGEFMEKGE